MATAVRAQETPVSPPPDSTAVDSGAEDSVAAPPEKPLKMRQRPVSDHTRKLDLRRSEKALDFPNVNKVAFYKDARALRKILRLEKSRRYRKAYTRLTAYVGKFGIGNFTKEYDMFWRLAQLTERVTHDTARARQYYRLALKHRRRNLKKVQLYYDSLEASTRDLYVPLKYYYELVEYRKNVAAFPTPKGINIKMSEEINSRHPDYGPSLNPDASVLVFSSKRRYRGLSDQPDENLYYALREGNGWTTAKEFPKPIASPFNEGSGCLSADGKTLIFARCECPDCHQNCDLFSSTLSADSTWGPPRNLGPNVNSRAWDSQPSLSSGGDTLYFASDRLGGFGLSDIWYAVRNRSGEWGKAQNMGPIINTRESEVSPYFHPLYQVLYFSSRGQLLNYGDFDIYKTYSAGGRWQEPRNIGPLVNGKGSEYYFTIDADSKNLYYAKSEPKDLKNLDIYSFPLPMEAQPLAVTHFSGTLVDSVTNMPLRGLVSIVDLTNGIEVASKYLREDGSFDFDLIDQARYAMLIQSPNYFTIEKQFDLATDTVMRVMTTLIDHKEALIFQNLEFEQNKSNITVGMQPILDRVALYMVDHPDYTLEINGHTDALGDPQENLDLSQFRSLAIKNYLVSKGAFDENRISATGYGSTEPLRSPERTEADRRINRRVEFKLIKSETETPPPTEEGTDGATPEASPSTTPSGSGGFD